MKTDENWISKHGLKKILNITGDDDVILSYSATCSPAENCNIYKPDIPWMINISHCDLKGMYKGQPFLVNNFSIGPMLASRLDVITFSNQRESYRLPSQDWRQCYDQRYIRNHACEKFKNKSLETKDTSGATPEYWQCQKDSAEETFACMRNHGTLMNTTEVRDSLYYYGLQFDIPSDNKTTGTWTSSTVQHDVHNKNPESTTISSVAQTLENSTVQTLSPTIPRSPVESLYCSILSFFGFAC